MTIIVNEAQENMGSLKRLVKLEIDRTADRMIKVHGLHAITHATQKVDVALKKGNTADHIFWMRIANKVKKELPGQAS